MNEGREKYTVNITDKSLIEQLKSFADENGVSAGDVVENALRRYFGGQSGEDLPPGEDVFNPDPGA